MVDASTPAMDSAGALAALACIVLGDNSFDAVLERATEVLKETLAGAAEVSVTLMNGKPKTAAFSGPLAVDVDESQYESGYGPCLDAYRLRQPIVVRDLATEVRWPEYVPKARAAGVVSSLSIPLPVGDRYIGALNIYSLQPDAFGTAEVEIGEQLAQYTGIVLNNADQYFTAATRADQMQQAMASRATIEQAKGILMGQRRCGAEEAFGVLVRLSQESGRKLRDVAQALVERTSAPERDHGHPVSEGEGR